MEKGPKGGPYRGLPDPDAVAKIRKENEEREPINLFLFKTREAMMRSDIYDDPFRVLPGQEHIEPGERMSIWDDELAHLQRTLTLLKTAMLVQEYGKNTPAGKANLESYTRHAGNDFPAYEIAIQTLAELTPEELQKLRSWTKVSPPVKK